MPAESSRTPICPAANLMPHNPSPNTPHQGGRKEVQWATWQLLQCLTLAAGDPFTALVMHKGRDLLLAQHSIVLTRMQTWFHCHSTGAAPLQFWLSLTQHIPSTHHRLVPGCDSARTSMQISQIKVWGPMCWCQPCICPLRAQG